MVICKNNEKSLHFVIGPCECCRHGKPPMFKVELVGNGHQVKIDDGLYAIQPQKNIEQLLQTDLIFLLPFQKACWFKSCRVQAPLCLMPVHFPLQIDAFTY